MFYKLCSFYILALVAYAGNASNDKMRIHLLTLVPQSEGAPDLSLPCVDRGEELLPAAELAANISNENILQDFHLEIVPVTTAKCSEDSFSLTLANFVRELTNPSYRVIGVVGMMCSSAILSVSPLASLPKIDILQITSGTVSPKSISNAREKVKIDKLYQTAPPSTIFNDKLLKLLKANENTQLAVIRHVGTFFIEHDIIATDLRQKVNDSQLNVSISDFEIVAANMEPAQRILDTIATNDSGIRVIYASVTIEEARLFLCLAVKRDVKLVYPRNQWIFHGHTFEELSEPFEICTDSDMREALEGVVLLQHSDRSMKDSPDILSHTTFTYSEYLKAYKSKLSGRNNTCSEKRGVIHINALYDSVVAFALAINNSLEAGSLRDFGIGNTSDNISTLLKDELSHQTFLGAGGTIQFDNETHEVIRNNTVDVVVVTNSTENRPKELSLNGTYSSNNEKIPAGLPIATIVLVFILVALHTITLLLFIYYWTEPDIKATSPVLGIVIFVACYMLDLSLLLTALRFSPFNISEIEFAAFCTVENWLLYIGVQLIFATLLMRLVRVYRIFFHYSKLGKIWSDYGVLLFILAFVSVGVAILTLWMAADLPFLHRDRTFISATDSPYFSVQFTCQSRYFEVFPIWIILLLVYTGVMMVIVLLLAIRTRKVKIESFKDTRTVNIFIYTTVVCFMFLIILSLIFDALRNQVVVFITRVLALSSVAIACACFLFLPKIYSAQYVRRHPRKKSLATQSSSGFVARNSFVMSTAL